MALVEAAGVTVETWPRPTKKAKKRKSGGEVAVFPCPEYAVGQVAGSLWVSAASSPGPLASLFSTGAGGPTAPIYVPAPRREAARVASPRGKPSEQVTLTFAPAKKPKILPDSEQRVSAREEPLQVADQQEEERERHVREKRKERRLQDAGEGGHGAPRPRNKAEERLKDLRTVFVGNLPISFTKQALRALFKGFGAIESVRFRSVARAEPTLNRKLAAIQRQMHPKRKSLHAYVVFKEEAAVGKALTSNGAQVEGGFNIRVDRVSGGEGHDNRRSVFVGNLPYDVEDQALRDFFSQCGAVAAVRIIRDRETGAGKGFGYVLFEGTDGVQLALKLDGSELMGRKLRVKRCVQKEWPPGHRQFAGSKHEQDPNSKFQPAKKSGAKKAKHGGHQRVHKKNTNTD